MRGASLCHAAVMESEITDCGSHLEVLTAAAKLRGEGFVDVLARASARFGIKPILVVCDDPRADVRLEDAYRVGIDIATRLRTRRVAIALRGRRPSEAEHFIELVAANRGTDVRYFADVAAARLWLLAP
jgi:hypothetical protein